MAVEPIVALLASFLYGTVVVRKPPVDRRLTRLVVLSVGIFVWSLLVSSLLIGYIAVAVLFGGLVGLFLIPTLGYAD